MNRIEILAPAGGEEQLIAAVHAGADAVYLGFGSFNARRNAKNFDYDALCKAINYCHSHNVAVHVALNTLVLENELDSALEDAISVAKAGADAVIVQDLGLAQMIHKTIPELPMHGSTQITVHNKSGVKMLEQMGFSRVVLSRELSLDEIRDICASANAEIEVFVHGALCMCMSGACYFSSVLGQRSGNRGLCAQPCRLDFNLNGRDYALSLKDMSHVEYIDKLIEAGVKSLKIEGRMKRPEYVACAVDACVKKINGEKPNMERLKKVFSRSGFTDGYMTGNRTVDMFGYRKKEDVDGSNSVLKEIASEFRNEKQTIPLSAEFILKENENALLTVSDGKNYVTVSGDVPQKSQNRSITEDDIKKQISKTGGTPFYLDNVSVNVDGGLMLPLSNVNAMRRNVLEQMSERLCDKNKYSICEQHFENSCHQAETRKYYVRVRNTQQLEFISKSTPIIIPLSCDIPEDFDDVTVEIPALVFGKDGEKVLSQLNEKKQNGIKKALCNNLGAIYMARQVGLEPVGGYGLNVINSRSLDVLYELGVKEAFISFETSINNFRKLSSKVTTGLIVYGYLPLMKMRACPAKKSGGCGNCSGINTVVDRKNVKFTLVCENKKFSTLLNSVPLFAADKDLDNAEILMISFENESPKEAGSIFKQIINKESPSFERTNGLYFKTLK